MMIGLVLILLAFILILIALFVSFRILPQLGGGGAGYNAEIGGAASPAIPPTPPDVRNRILGFCGLVSLILIGFGLLLIVREQSHSWQVETAHQTQLSALSALASTPPPSVTATRTSPAGSPAATTPGPRPTPMTPPTSVTDARALFNEAVALDEAGKNAAAIDRYKQALKGDLDPARDQAARLEIGLLSLLAVKDSDTSACGDAREYLQPLSLSATDLKTRQTAADALGQVVSRCK